MRPQDQPRDEKNRWIAVSDSSRSVSVKSQVDSAIKEASNLSKGTKAKVEEALTAGFESFSKPKLSEDEIHALNMYKMGDTNVAAKELMLTVEKGIVLKDITIYRVAESEYLRRTDRVTSFSIRKDWAENYAMTNDLPMISKNLKKGDKALFVPHFNSGHISEVEVLIMQG